MIVGTDGSIFLIVFNVCLIVDSRQRFQVFRWATNRTGRYYAFQEYLDEYNSTARAEMHLVLFKDAMEHVVRVARVLRAERGHCLMVGPGGSGRRSVATLAGHVNECKLDPYYDAIAILANLNFT